MEKFVVTQGKYALSAVKKDQYPENKLAEFVFIGRSNVGKSSLINSLARTKKLARVSGQPGKTQTINFYELGIKNKDTEERKNFYLVDLPGYGYAKTGKENRKIWAKFIDEYLLSSGQIKFVCQLIDSRHDPMPADIEMFRWLVKAGLPVLVIATKVDKLGTVAREKNLQVIRRGLGVPDLDVLPYSALKNIGRDELVQTIADTLWDE